MWFRILSFMRPWLEGHKKNFLEFSPYSPPKNLKGEKATQVSTWTNFAGLGYRRLLEELGQRKHLFQLSDEE